MRNLPSRHQFPWLRSRFTLGLLTVGCLALPMSVPASAEYRLEAGDVLEISVVGVPELHARATVDIDGKISFPLIGNISVVGSTVSELRDRVTKLLDDKVVGKTAEAAPASLGQIPLKQVMIDVAEYPPVYLIGDVARSGAQPFRPGLTVRQAISLAGGVDRNRGKPNPAGAGAADQYSSLWIDYAREQARVWRLEREQDGQHGQPGGDPHKAAPAASLVGQFSATTPSALELINAPLPPSVLRQITVAEANQLQLGQASSTKERDFLKGAITQVDSQLALLGQQQAKERSESGLDDREFDKLQSYYQRGLVTMDRLSSGRHAAFSTATQIVQTGSAIVQTQRERADLALRLEKLESDRRIGAVRDLEEANIQLAKLRDRLRTIGDNIISVSDSSGGASAKPQQRWRISIVHQGNPASPGVSASEDTTLMPGDVVQVATGNDDPGPAITRVEAQGGDAPLR